MHESLFRICETRELKIPNSSHYQVGWETSDGFSWGNIPHTDYGTAMGVAERWGSHGVWVSDEEGTLSYYPPQAIYRTLVRGCDANCLPEGG